MSNRNEWLVLVPTEKELGFLNLDHRLRIELCGFGPVAAAARTAALIAKCRPSRIMLVGIAGVYDQRFDVGNAYEFSLVQSVGIGIGLGTQHVSAEEAGWMHYSPAEIGDRLSLQCSHGESDSRLLLTVCAACGDKADASARTMKFPEAVAEDMEGYGVALAGALAGIPVHVVRGISNVAGDRDHSKWQICAALESAGELAQSIIGEG